MRDPASSADGVWRALHEVLDPCLAAGGHRVSVVDLGLITRVEAGASTLEIGITFTEVGCPFTHRVIDRIECELRKLEQFETIRVVPEWLPGWTPQRMNATARRALGDGRLALRQHLDTQRAKRA